MNSKKDNTTQRAMIQLWQKTDDSYERLPKALG